MDKLLAMSILSAGPDNFSGNWWLSLLPAGDKLTKKTEVKNENEKRVSKTSSSRNDSNTKYSLISKENKPRFAMEFDGLNCFETIISH